MPWNDQPPSPWRELPRALAGITTVFLDSVTHLSEVILDFSKMRSERQRDAHAQDRVDAEVAVLQDVLRLRAAALPIASRSGMRDRLVDFIFQYDIKQNGCSPTHNIWRAYFELAWRLFEQEKFDQIEAPSYTNNIEKGRHIDKLIAQAERLKDTTRLAETFVETIGYSFLTLAKQLPKSAFTVNDDAVEAPSIGTIPLIDTLQDIHNLSIDVISPCFRETAKDLKLFAELERQIKSNDARAGGALPSPSDYKGDRKAFLDAYLGGTPFRELFDVAIPYQVPLSKQLEHSMIAAGSRFGKSQLIGSIIASHLQSDNPPGIIVLDSTGDFADKISQLSLFEPGKGILADKLLLLDPADGPQLNMFDHSTLHSKGYSERDLQRIEADIINLFDYVFSSIGGELSSQQSMGFSFLVRLMVSIPGSTLQNLAELLEHPAKSYETAPQSMREAIERLDPTTQRFFKNHFFSDTMRATRLAVGRRLLPILKNDFFNRMFTGADRIDFFQAMQEGKIIVVNTDKANLKDDASALFGRYIIARIMSAAFERAVIRDMNKRRPCLFFIDEAQEYFDESIDTLLTQIGKFRLGLCLAFQYFGQLNERLKTSVLGNTTVKYVGGLIASEARMVAEEMRTDQTFLLVQRKDTGDRPEWAQFATHIRYSGTPTVSLTVPFYALENLSRMDTTAYTEMRRLNREKVAGPIALSQPEPAEPPAASPAQSPPKADDDTATDW